MLRAALLLSVVTGLCTACATRAPRAVTPAPIESSGPDQVLDESTVRDDSGEERDASAAGGGAEDAPAPRAEPETAPGPGAMPGPGTAPNAPEEAAAGPLDGRKADPSRALPRLSTRHIGMHIGGDPNTPESKKPFLDVLSRGERGFLRCYRLVSRPMSGGTFGVDLFVPKAGGTPEVRGVRQKLGGVDFEECMSEAFTALRFGPPARPTLVSYSLRFDVSAK